MLPADTSTSWGLYDVVQVDGRTGTVSLDLRPGHNYVKVKWSDTQTESKVICADEVKTTENAQATTEAFKKGSDFSSSEEYTKYLKCTLKVGMRVRGISGSRAGDTGVFSRDDGSSRPEFRWDKHGSTWYTSLSDVEISEQEDATSQVKVGDPQVNLSIDPAAAAAGAVIPAAAAVPVICMQHVEAAWRNQTLLCPSLNVIRAVTQQRMRTLNANKPDSSIEAAAAAKTAVSDVWYPLLWQALLGSLEVHTHVSFLRKFSKTTIEQRAKSSSVSIWSTQALLCNRLRHTTELVQKVRAALRIQKCWRDLVASRSSQADLPSQLVARRNQVWKQSKQTDLSRAITNCRTQCADVSKALKWDRTDKQHKPPQPKVGQTVWHQEGLQWFEANLEAFNSDGTFEVCSQYGNFSTKEVEVDPIQCGHFPRGMCTLQLDVASHLRASAAAGYVDAAGRPTKNDIVRLKVDREGLSQGDICKIVQDDKDGSPYKMQKMLKTNAASSNTHSYYTEKHVQKLKKCPSETRFLVVPTSELMSSSSKPISAADLILKLAVRHGPSGQSGQVVGFRHLDTLVGDCTVKKPTWRNRADEKAWKLAQLFGSTQVVVGMHRVKELLHLLVEDVCGRVMVGEAHTPRHFLLTGHMGTGKRLSAHVITQLISVVDPEFNPVIIEDYESFGNSTSPGSDPQLVALLDVQLGKLGAEHATGTAQKQMIHYRIIEDLASDSDKLDELIEKMEQHDSNGDIVLLSGEPDLLNKLIPIIPQFLKRAPHVLPLNDLTPTELAQLTLDLLRHAGYELSCSGMPVGASSNLDLMLLIVNQTYTTEQITTGGFYLGTELKERAISVSAYSSLSLSLFSLSLFSLSLFSLSLFSCSFSDSLSPRLM